MHYVIADVLLHWEVKSVTRHVICNQVGVKAG
jgi:hypothetical protein